MGTLRPEEMKSNAYTHSLPTPVSFTGEGLLEYAFGPLNQKDVAVDTTCKLRKDTTGRVSECSFSYFFSRSESE